MTDWVAWFRYQLQASTDGFEWAYFQIDPTFRQQLPPAPHYLGTWPPARHVWHVTEHDSCLVIPSMLQWLGGSLPPKAAWRNNDNHWRNAQTGGIEDLVINFRRIRRLQMELLERLADADWDAPRETLWGAKPLSMVVTKTFQHTYEHGDTLLRMGLWWQDKLASTENPALDG